MKMFFTDFITFNYEFAKDNKLNYNLVELIKYECN